MELLSSGHRDLPKRVSLIYGYQKNRAGIHLHHVYPTLCQQPSQTEGPSSSFLHYLVLYTGTSSHTKQKEKQVPALFQWQTDNACPSSQGAIVLSLCTFPRPFQAALISLCMGQLMFELKLSNHYSKGGRGLSLGRANSGLKD